MKTFYNIYNYLDNITLEQADDIGRLIMFAMPVLTMILMFVLW